MIENSSAGLFMLRSEVTVTVTREEHHQQVLARYPVDHGSSHRVAAELAWCTIESGKYRGQYAIEVRLDGYRVGELTYAMSQRYGAIMRMVADRGHRPGCEAVVHLGKRGIEIDLQLPSETTTVTVPAAVVAEPTVGRAEPARRNTISSKRKPIWIAAGVVGVVVLAGVVSQPDNSAPTAGDSVSPVTTSITSTTSSTPAPITTPQPASVAPVVPPPAADPAPVIDPAPPAATPKKAPAPPPAPKNDPAPPAPKSKCDPNYTGCVPIASDVDCEGGSGNGPAYVRGPVEVIGKDIYGLDHNKDGIGCE
ncbi:MAG: hypothetical protein ABW215_23310 [Kibdelosporangium sp.]